MDEFELAHRAVGGTGRGRRYATQQINHAYAVLLASQFQRFCRDLQSEAVDQLATLIPHPDVANIFREQLTSGRKLDSGNPNSGNIGSDFGQLGMHFWSAVSAAGTHKSSRQGALDLLIRWRNAIAHQDFDPTKLGGRSQLQLANVQKWRATCNALAKTFDDVLAGHWLQYWDDGRGRPCGSNS